MLCLIRGHVVEPKTMFLKIMFFLGKPGFSKPRLRHICGTLGSQTPFPFAAETFHS